MARTLADDMVADLELALPESIRWIPMSERSIAAQRLVQLGWTKPPQVPAPTTGEQGRTTLSRIGNGVFDMANGDPDQIR